MNNNQKIYIPLCIIAILFGVFTCSVGLGVALAIIQIVVGVVLGSWAIGLAFKYLMEIWEITDED